MTEQVILVDNNDNEVGLMDKMEAHISGTLHRAFSIFIFNSRAELLLQQRALTKYHSAGKWTNTCCSHPRIGETTMDAANRRLAEEMGMACNLTYKFNFVYKAEVNEGILEHEFDHVFFGISNEKPVLEPNEVANYCYMDMDTLAAELKANPENYTEWLKICFHHILLAYNKEFRNGNID